MTRIDAIYKYIHTCRHLYFLLAGVVQYLQFRYQQGVLYRLKALGERHNMDITIEGFHSWMWRGLSFLLPFLYVGYIYQLYNAYTLYSLIFHPEATWQVSLNVCLFHLYSLNAFCKESIEDADTVLLCLFQKPLQTSNLRFVFIWADTLHKNISSLTVYTSVFYHGLVENIKYIYCMLLSVCMVAVAVGTVLQY